MNVLRVFIGCFRAVQVGDVLAERKVFKKLNSAKANDYMDVHSVNDMERCFTSHYIEYTLFNINVKPLVGIAKLMHPSLSLQLHTQSKVRPCYGMYKVH